MLILNNYLSILNTRIVRRATAKILLGITESDKFDVSKIREDLLKHPDDYIQLEAALVLTKDAETANRGFIVLSDLLKSGFPGVREAAMKRIWEYLDENADVDRYDPTPVRSGGL